MGHLSGNPRVLGGTAHYMKFEDVMTAYSTGCRNIYIPIKSFDDWEVEYSGQLDTIT